MSLILDGSTGISGSAGVIDAETFAGQANTYYTDISARLGYTPLSNVNPSYSGTLTGNTGIINIGSGQFYKDANGQVGIGTTSPSYRLSVKQSANTSSASLGVVSINSANDTFIGIGYDATSDTNRVLSSYISTGAFKPISFWTSDSQRMKIDISGNVGIGTASPASKLHLSGSTAAVADLSGGIRITNTSFTADTYSGMLFATADGLNSYVTAIRQTSFAGVLAFGTNNGTDATSIVERMRIDSSGNVGIGTSSPASKLHVSGSFRQTGATVPFEWTVNSGAADFYKLNAVGFADNLIVANSSGNVGIGVIPTTKLDVSGNVKVSGSLSVAGIFNNLSAANRRQVWSHVGLFIANGASADIIRNRAGYSRAIVEVYAQSQHGSNGYFYRMYQLSRYGLDNMVVASSGTMDHVTISLNGNSGTNDNAIRFSVSGSPTNGGVTFPLFVAVSYFGSETGFEFDSPAGLTRIS